MKMTMNMTKLAAAVCLSMSMGLGIVSAQDMSMPAGPMMSQGMPPQACRLKGCLRRDSRANPSLNLQPLSGLRANRHSWLIRILRLPKPMKMLSWQNKGLT